MKNITSAGGVVFFNNSILLLKKINGDWVLPKGRMESGETLEETALREVKEESDVKANIVEYLGDIKYTFRNSWSHNETTLKTVYWYLMRARSFDCHPLKTEGFVEAKFIHINNVEEKARYADERQIISLAVGKIKKIIGYEVD